MFKKSSFIRLLSLVSSLPICLAIHNPFEPGTSRAHVLLPRRRGAGIYQESCQETYGSGYAECYGTCYNAGAGETCCEGNYKCPNGQYCGYGPYSYCCFDYQTPTECAAPYAIAAPPPSWRPGDGDAPSSITDAPTTSTYIPRASSTTTSRKSYTKSDQTSTYSADTTSSTRRAIATGGGAGNGREESTSTEVPGFTEFSVPTGPGSSSQLASGAEKMGGERKWIVVGTVTGLLGIIRMRRVCVL